MSATLHQSDGSRDPQRGQSPRQVSLLRRLARLAVAAFAVLVVTAACTNSQAAESILAPTTQEQVALNLPADFQFTVYQGEDLLGGETLNLSDLFTHGKPVVLNFWAGLCPPCRLEMPHFQRVYDQRGQDFIILGLDVGPFTLLGSSEEGQALLQELNVTYPAGTPSDGSSIAAYGVLGMPTTVFLTPDGTVHRTWVGLLTEDKLTELIDSLLAASSVS